MTTAIDTNILVALWNEDDTLNTLARSALDAALARGSLVNNYDRVNPAETLNLPLVGSRRFRVRHGMK